MSRVEFELAALRGRSPVAIDVAGRVMERIAILPPPSAVRETPSRRPAAIAACLAAVVAATGMIAALPIAWAVLGGNPLQALGLLRSTGGSATTVSAVTRGLFGVLELAGAIFRAAVSALEPLRPAATAVSLTLVAITVATVVLIVVRDVARAPVLEEI